LLLLERDHQAIDAGIGFGIQRITIAPSRSAQRQLRVVWRLAESPWTEQKEPSLTQNGSPYIAQFLLRLTIWAGLSPHRIEMDCASSPPA